MNNAQQAGLVRSGCTSRACNGGATGSLLWKLNRLRAMGVPEILYRVRQAVGARLEKRGYGLARSQPPSGKMGKAWCAHLPPRMEAEPYRAAADRVLGGRFDVFALEDVDLGFPPDWNRDPKTGTRAPLIFGKTLDYRDERLVGDIKYLWEPNRHQELVTLAQAWALSGEERYASGCRVLLESWFAQCPYPLGPNWTSSLEHAVRLVNWSVAWQLLGGAQSPLFDGTEGKAFLGRWLDSVYQHCRFISGYFSKHSSANNHLFGEYMGLFMGALMWPCWRESARWLELARTGLEEEALRQNAEDGVNREQAIWYHHEVADMMLLCGLAGRANGVTFSAAWWQRLEAMLEFIASLMDVGGKVPMLGDSDDAVMVRFSREPDFDVYRSLLATGAALFGRADFARKAGNFDTKSWCLMGGEAADAFERLRTRSTSSSGASEGKERKQAFQVGGYYILGDGFDSADEIRIVADSGPLGYLSIAAHGHADALSLTLSMGGHEVLVDSGTYAYHTHKKWRDYFRGTSAHNTVRVDGEDQSVIGGNFMWLRHAKARCESWESDVDRDRLVGSHDGYGRLADPVTHRRSLEFDKKAKILRIADTLVCKETHSVEIFWHFAEGCQVRRTDNEISAHCINQRVKLAMPGCDWVPGVVAGQEDPPLGWISRRFDRKCQTVSVVWSGLISGTTTLNTEIHLDGTDLD